MSRRDEFKQLTNPATKFIEWSSEGRCFRYYQKNADGTGQKVDMPLPVGFLVLKQCYTIKGFDDTAKAGIWSNEVDSLKNPFDVKVGKGIALVSGIWKDIKPKVEASGGVFCISVYAMTKQGELINFQFHGASLGRWIDFTQKTRARLADEWVMVKGVIEDKKGAVKFTAPVFEFYQSIAKGSEYDLKAEECYNVITDYLTAYFAKNGTAPIEDEAQVDEELNRKAAEFYNSKDAEPTMEQKTAMLYGKAEEQKRVANPPGAEPFDSEDDDLPF